jgi:hypothetical protein
MVENNNSGAQDWRSELEKRKSLLRKSAIALFKTWIPDHAEASIARGEVFALFQGSLHQYARAINLVNQLSFGSEDITAHEFATEPISLQELLVQREGTDAFLDAKNALRVVRRKFGMMTLISRMASTMEQRNIASIRIQSDIDQETLLKFGKLMSRRVEGTSTEEEEEFRRQLRRLNSNHISVLFHVDVIGRKVPVPWPIKEIYSKLAILNERDGVLSNDGLAHFCNEHASQLTSKSVRQLSLYNGEMRQDLGDSAHDPFPSLLRAANERLVLTATRNLFDEFNELRILRKQRAALHQSGEHVLTEEATQAQFSDDETDFAAEASELGGVDSAEILRLGKTLDLIRTIMGRAFFIRISMVSGDLNFADAASGKTAVNDQFEADTMANPVEALRRARAISEPLYRCRSLGTVTPTLVSAGRFDDAMAAASESLDSARVVPGEDRVSAFTIAIRALVETEQPELAASAVTESINTAHNFRDLVERSGALVRIASTLIETGTLPILVKRAVSRSILGPDVYFWGKDAVKSTLVEAVIAIISSKEDDSLIFLQKVIVHNDPAVRCSVIRTMPLNGIPHLEKMLLGHLKDHDVDVRLEVIERLGSSSQVRFAAYIANAIRQGEFTTDEEKLSLALNLGRLDPDKQYHVYNAMLGQLGLDDPKLTDRMPKFKDDEGLQLAALQALHHLRSREARRVLFHASHDGRGKKAIQTKAEQLWELTKNLGYDDPMFPRSSHDPEWSEEDIFNFEQFLAGAPTKNKQEDGERIKEASGMFGWVKSLFSSDESDGDRIEPLNDSKSPTDEPDAPNEISTDRSDEPLSNLQTPSTNTTELNTSEISESSVQPSKSAVEPQVGFKIEAMIQRASRAWSGDVQMVFCFHASDHDDQPPLYSESKSDVRVTAGRFEVILGSTESLPDLPKKVWLTIEVDGHLMEQRLEITPYRSVIQG